MTVNREMFAEIHKLITEFPELHDQHTWSAHPEDTGKCGTTRCVAGWAVWLGAKEAGLLSRKREMTDAWVRMHLADRLGVQTADYEDNWYYNGYTRTEYPVLGGKLLGLEGDQASSLFHDMNADRVVARVRSYAETGEDLSEEQLDSFDD